MTNIGKIPQQSKVVTTPVHGQGLDTKTLSKAGQQLKTTGEGAAKLPMGPERADAFGKLVLPVLLADVGKILGVDPAKLTGVLAGAVEGAGSSEPTLGLRNGEQGIAADTDYPPRAANATWNDFASALGISKRDAAAVTKLNDQIGAYPKAEGKYAPAFEQLSPELQQLATHVSRSLLGEEVKLNSTELAFKANLVLNNLTWHMTNWERASGDATRADPLARNNVFNNYSDNLAYANLRGGLPAVIDMAISDAYNAGKPGVGKAALMQPKAGLPFTAVAQQPPATANRLQGDIAPGAQVMVPQKNVFGE